MYKKIRYLFAILALLSTTVKAQLNIQSPYSGVGIGNLKGSMGLATKGFAGVSTAIGSLTTYSSTINAHNPASYTSIYSTTIDVGANANFVTLSQTGHSSETNAGASISHVALGFNTSRNSGISLGLVPYSEVGYDVTNTVKIDTMSVNHVYKGEGGLSKAYFGYAYRIGENLSLGANVEYLFGTITNAQSVEYAGGTNVMNSRNLNRKSVGGFTFSYGVQYETEIKKKMILSFGYSGSLPSRASLSTSNVVTRYTKDISGNELSALDTISNKSLNTHLQVPISHNFGVALHKENKWMLGTDFRMSSWSKYKEAGVNQGLKDAWGVSLGGQIIPNATSIGSYLNRVEYRAGVSYDKTYLNINNRNINQMAVTVGLGLPLANNRFSFHKMNIAAEFGSRGTLTDNLIKEKFVILHLGFTLNETWFRRYRLE